MSQTVEALTCIRGEWADKTGFSFIDYIADSCPYWTASCVRAFNERDSLIVEGIAASFPSRPPCCFHVSGYMVGHFKFW